MWKSTFFARFSLSGSRCISDAITSTKLEQTGEFLDSRCCLSAWYLRFEHGHKCEMSGYLLIVKYLAHRFCWNSVTVYWIWGRYRGIWGGFLKTFLEASVAYTGITQWIGTHFFTSVSPVQPLLAARGLYVSRAQFQPTDSVASVPRTSTLQWL